jgi:8-oxo-dGTP diphosphatase
VVCSHRPVFPQLLATLGLADRKLEPAEMLVVHHRGGEPVAIEIHRVR